MVCPQCPAFSIATNHAPKSVPLVDRSSPRLIAWIQTIPASIFCDATHPMPVRPATLIHTKPLCHTISTTEGSLGIDGGYHLHLATILADAFLPIIIVGLLAPIEVSKGFHLAGNAAILSRLVRIRLFICVAWVSFATIQTGFHSSHSTSSIL